jgi:multiple sugar transport system ATP-binding protein
MARVELDRLTKVFAGPGGQQIQAVRALSLAVRDKEFLVLAGPSGCGKTTTLRLIAGLEQPSTGVISIDGQTVNSVPAKDRNVAMVFQNLALYPHMTAYENMAFGLRARKHSTTEIRRRIEEAAAILALEDCLDRRPSALSGGQRQRVALGRAIVLQPGSCFWTTLVEPDAPLRAPGLVVRCINSGTTIYVTHGQIPVMALATNCDIRMGFCNR